jgi:hypothetical protein
VATISPSTLKGVAWFPTSGGRKPEGGLRSTLIKLAVSGVVGGLFFATQRPVLAYVVWGIGGALAGLSFASEGIRKAIDGALARFGRAVGMGLGAALLTVVYLLVITPVRFVRRALGADDLHLRDADKPSHWLACDDEERKARWVGSMFATEAPRPGGSPVRKALVMVFVALLLAEGVLRLKGFGHTVLYVADPDVGYFPEPNVSLDRYGGRVSTNEFGMRSPHATKQKPAGAFRIFMIGDSTLYGGSYIDQEQIYASHVRSDLNKKGLPGPVEVLAMGCNGWGPFHERGYLKREGTFEADVAMIQLPIDDVNRPLYGLMNVPFFSVQSPPKLGLEEVANHLMWRYRSAHSGLDAAWEAKQSKAGIAEYGKLVDDFKKAGVEVMVFVLPEREPGFGGHEVGKHKEWRLELERTVIAHGAKPYFAAGWFQGKGKPDEIYHDGMHLEPAGHRAYAQFIEEKLMTDSARFRAFAGTK